MSTRTPKRASIIGSLLKGDVSAALEGAVTGTPIIETSAQQAARAEAEARELEQSEAPGSLPAPPSSEARVVLVTGAARGIGRAIAQRHAAAGDRVIVHFSTSAAAAEDTRSSLPRVEAGAHICLQADLSVPGNASRLIDEAVRQCNGLDVLVCNHGIYEVDALTQ